MTITPDRLDDLDFEVEEFTPPTGAEVLEAVQDAFRRITDDPWQCRDYRAAHEGLWDCYCSPSRSAYINRLLSWPEPITRWDPPLPKVTSKELVVIKP